MAVAVCASDVQGKRSDIPSLAGVPEPDAKVGGVERPRLGGIAAEIEWSGINFEFPVELGEVDGCMNDGKYGFVCPKSRLW